MRACSTSCRRSSTCSTCRSRRIWRGTSCATRWMKTSRSGIPRQSWTRTGGWSGRRRRRKPSSTATSWSGCAPSATSTESVSSAAAGGGASAHREAPAEPERRFREREAFAVGEGRAVAVEAVAAQLEAGVRDRTEEQPNAAAEAPDGIGFAAEVGVVGVDPSKAGGDVRDDAVRREVEDVRDLGIADVRRLPGEESVVGRDPVVHELDLVVGVEQIAEPHTGARVVVQLHLVLEAVEVHRHGELIPLPEPTGPAPAGLSL